MAIGSKAVLAYLRQHPEFLQTHAAELGYCAVAEEGKVLSFRQGSVDALRHKTERMAAQLAVMLDNAEYNRETAAKLQRFNCRLLGAKTVGQLFQAASAALREDFALPNHAFRVMRLPENKARIPPALQAADDTVLQGVWADAQAPECGTRMADAARALLAAGAESFLQLPVSHKGQLLAVLLVGHEDPGYFHAGLGTELVSHMADSLAAALVRLMGLAD